MRMLKHGGEQLRVERISKGRQCRKEQKEDQICNEEDHGDDLEPMPVVGQLMAHD